MADTIQSYANHRRNIPGFGALLLVTALTAIGSLVNLYLSLGDHQRLYSASLITVLAIVACIHLLTTRRYATKLQDRAVRAEESLRQYVLTGKLPDPRITIGQMVALRFASDGEVADLARRAADEKLAPDAIKQAVKQWRADTYRV